MLGEGIAGLGMWVGIIGNLEFLQLHVQSDFHKSLILLAGLFIGVLFGPAAGRTIDRFKKKQVMIYSGILRIFSVICMFLAISQESVIWMVGYMLLIGTSGAFYFPALQAALPMIAKEDELLSLNGLHMNVGTIARIAGTALGGIMLTVFSLYTVYMATFISYIFIVCCTFALNIEGGRGAGKLSKEKEDSKKRGSFKDLWPVVGSVPAVMLGLVLMLVPISFIGSFNLMVLKISEMQQDPSIKGWLYTAEGLCFMAGAFLIKKVSKGRSTAAFLLATSLLISLSHLSLVFAEVKIMSIISFSMFGLAAGGFFPLIATLFQKKVPSEYHGRFFSFRNMMDRVLFQAVLVGTGFFLDTIGFQYMVILFGSLSLLLSSWMLIRNKKGPVYHESRNAAEIKR